ncbi:acetyltransferase, ribosomal protein N-acetylase [gamma proteobacterium HIMB55]|nr:acetyltransferase, ribosomal protein N-acetylase [gamma proteobacterium HIMB55]
MPSSVNLFPEPIHTQSFSLEGVAESDFESLYAVASDPLIWEQHPESNRWQRDVFSVFFANGLANDLGCFVIRERLTQEVVGSTRYYGYDETDRCVRIGFTFLARKHWGTSANREIKDGMLERAFKLCESVLFDIGPENRRSITAVEKLGGVYSHTESPTKAVYVLKSSQWAPVG